MNTIKRIKISAVIFFILLAISFVTLLILNKNKLIKQNRDDLYNWLYDGISWYYTDCNMICLKVIAAQNNKDTMNIAVPIDYLYYLVCNDLKMFNVNSSKFDHEFIQCLIKCIDGDQPMNVSVDLYNILNKDCAFDLDEKLQEKYKLHGADYFIDSNGWIKNGKWSYKDGIITVPEKTQNEIDNLIYFLQRNHIGVLLTEESPDFCWGYKTYRY